MDVLNFISWIKRKDYRETMPPGSLTVVGVPDPTRDDGYLSVVVPVTAFAGSGTVTSVSKITLGTSGTDLSSTVANGTTTPVITLNVPNASATNRGALSSTDWSIFNGKQSAITLTTLGSSGSSTLISNILNIPTYTLSGLGGATSSTNITINGTTYDLSNDRTWTVGDITSSSTYSNPSWITSLDYSKLTGVPSIPSVTPSALTKIDDTNVTLTLGGTPATSLLESVSLTLGWVGTLADNRITSSSTWNAKQDSITLTTTGTSGAATLIGSTLNIPNYAGGGSTIINESKAIYVDATYGNDSTGVKYNLAKPFLTWAGAIAVAVAGDWIIFNAGSYNGGTMTPVNNVNVFCKPGVTISGGFSIASSITWKFLGNAIFTSTDPLRVVGTGQTYDIQFDFDKIDGVISFGIIIADNTTPSCKLLVNCNSIIASQPFRLNGGAAYDVVVNCKNKLSTYGSQAITIGNSTTSPISGSIVINCPIIETTSTASNRNVISFSNNYVNSKIVINSSIIRSTSTTFTDNGTNNLGCVVWIDGTDNIFINGDLEGGAIPCIINRTGGATPVYGNITFTGNMYSDREIVQQYQKFSNGNGWNNIIIKNGYISSKGIGSSNAMFHRANLWNSVMNGIPGSIQLVNCIVHNINFNASATACIMKDDVNLTGTTGWVIKRNNFQMYNCLAFITGGVGFLISTIQSNKETMLHNVRSNVDKMATVTDLLSPTGLIVDANLIIPITRL